MFGDVLNNGLTCLIYHRKMNTNEARLHPPNMKRDVKFLSNESLLHLHEITSYVKRIAHERILLKARFQEKTKETWK